MKFRALEAAENVVWAMEQNALQTLLAIAAREHDTDPEALEAYRARAAEGADQMEVRDGVAIISANGPMFKRANLFTAISGATSYEIMRRDLQLAVDRKMKGAILNLDTPGGDASGAGELAAYIASLRGRFPVIAYVNGVGASAGYWIASAAQEIVLDPSAVVGSIGIQWAMRERAEPEGTTTHTFISSQSPLKNADPGSESGAKQIQAVVDAMAAVFVEAVASNRGVATETVLSDFGRGGILVGDQAVKARMADRLGNFESVLAELSAGRTSRKAKGAKMSDETFSKAELDAAVASAVTAAMAASNARIAGIHRVAAGFGLDAAAISAAIASDQTVEAFALDQADKAAKARADKVAADEAAAVAASQAGAKPDGKKAGELAALKSDEEIAAEAAASSGNDPDGESIDAIAARIAAS